MKTCIALILFSFALTLGAVTESAVALDAAAPRVEAGVSSSGPEDGFDVLPGGGGCGQTAAT